MFYDVESVEDFVFVLSVRLVGGDQPLSKRVLAAAPPGSLRTSTSKPMRKMFKEVVLSVASDGVAKKTPIDPAFRYNGTI